MILWNYDLDDRAYRARLMASLADTPIELRTVDVYPGREHEGAAMRALTPLARVPVLVDDTLVLRQVEAILLHLARSGSRGAAFMPEGADRARMDDWLAFAARDADVFSKARAAMVLGAPGDGEALRGESVAVLRILEDHLTASAVYDLGFVAGASPTVADIALFPVFALSRDIAIDHDGFPALRAWARRVRALPGFIGMPGIPDYQFI